MSTLALTVVSVVCAVAGVAAAATLTRRRGTPVGARALLVAAGAAGAGGVLATAVVVARGQGFVMFTVAHLAYLGVTVTVPLLAVGLAAVAGPVGRRTAPRPVWAVLAVALLPVPVGVYATHVAPHRLRVEEVAVAVDPARAGDDEVRIAVLADLQTNRVGDHERRAVDEVLAAEPDVILLPGDLFQGTDAELDDEVGALRDLLGRLRAPHGVFFVEGDVDGGGHARRVLEGTGIEVLDDEVTELAVGDRTLRIGGTALAYGSAAADAVRADLLATPDDGAVTVLVSHRPDTVLGLPEGSRVDLTVAGHTHGGQVVIPGFGPPVTFTDVPRSVARGGLHAVAGNPIYVSPGVGLERGSAPQVRLFSRPAVGVLTLRDA
ncbi:MAG TPA: metallophosphoesterase [Iamia sp.]|nr:metallophosphoesterase [Iamia sp.]